MSLGTGSWFGASGDCGCCGDRPPVPVCCPDLEDCIPEGFLNFSSMRAVFEIDDEFEFYERFHVPFCSGPCLGQDRVFTWDYKLSGIASVNGSYDAKYITQNPVTFEYVEIDPDRRNVCGSWWFPWIEVAVVNTYRETRTDSGGCFSPIDTTTDGPGTVWFSPYLGRFFTSKTDLSHPFLPLFLGHQTNTSHPIVTPCDPKQMDNEYIGYTCVPKSTVNVSQYGHTEQSPRPVSCSALPSLATGFSLLTFFGNTTNDGAVVVGGPVGLGEGVGSPGPVITVDGVDGHIAGALPACTLHYQSVEKTIQPYNFFDSRNATCFPTVPDPLVNEIEWTEFNRKHSILINV